MWSGLLLGFLDLGCIALVATTGFEDQLEKALVFAVAAGFLLGLLVLGAQWNDQTVFSVQSEKTLHER